MIKYINTERLKAEIERRKGELMYGSCSALIQVETNCKNEAYNEILSFITSLQQEQPEVDLEKEVKKYFEGYWPGMKTPEACNHQMVFTTPAIMRMIEYFYELGLNARKEE